MKTYKDIYKFPLVKSNYNHWVYDKGGKNFVFQFEPRWTNGDYSEGYLELEEKLLDAINGKCAIGKHATLSEGQIFIDGESEAIITIRGWGNLTGIGGHRLSSDEAANIQDTFAEYIISQLKITI